MLTAALGSSFIHNRSVSAEPKPLAETVRTSRCAVRPQAAARRGFTFNGQGDLYDGACLAASLAR